ncbi:MAG: glycosyltransferase family 2 protein [Prevotella sp.]|nr:glycosyltransferase family 2 protein [Prevotella sp.]
MKLSIIIVSYNVRYYLQQCLESVERASANIDAEVIVYDNHSSDDSVGYLQPLFPNVRFIEGNHNIGFARGNNVAIRQSKGEYVLLLNPDTFIGEDVLSQTLAFMDQHPKAGALGVQMLNNDGTRAMESRRGIPSPMTAFYKLSGLCRRFPKSRRFGHYYMGYLSWDEPQQIEVVSGAFCLLRRDALNKVGLLDEDFFMYGEDIDLSYRILKGGFENWYHPVRILHYKGESTEKTSFRYVHVFYEAMLIFFRKHYSHLGLLVSIPIRIAVWLKATAALFGMLVTKARKALGLAARQRRQAPDYVFVGTEQASQSFLQTIEKKGLEARTIIGDSQTLPEGHNGQLNQTDSHKQVCVVYDTEAYGYREILNIFAHNTQPNVTIGTYSQQNNIIITSKEILT